MNRRPPAAKRIQPFPIKFDPKRRTDALFDHVNTVMAPQASPAI